ncbi:T9SS type A sorting domain-containing protein [Eudoraea chungangensis]|uniref:T9SS type A sorting domain-containing protein n=1 Tax=Eudoraea chungangensis TaxID=1481905 RepID=UPI0023ECB5D0|nr:T9SS type A sorting domain-containing protein [Eudoraea chungangensis]
MKQTYFFILLFFSLLVSAQEVKQKNDKDQNISGLTLYPNPAVNDIVYVRTDSNDLKLVTVFDVFGKTVLLDRLRNNALNIVSLSPGVYLVQVVENNHKMTRKLIVK